MERIFTPVVAQRRSPRTAILSRKPGLFRSKLHKRSAFFACLFIFSFGSSPAFADAPTAIDQTVSTDEDTALDITLTGTDPESDPLTYAIGTSPTDGVLTGTAPNVTYTPNTDFNGEDSFTFTVNDGTDDSAEATVTITVNPVNDPPTAIDQTLSTDEDTDLDITLTGFDLEGDAMTFTVETQPSNGTLN